MPHNVNPATAAPLPEPSPSSPADVDAAIKKATDAFSAWSATPPVVRSRILLKAVQLLRQRNDELAVVETEDTGKPFSETSAVDLPTGADVLEFYANLVGGGGLSGETTQLREHAWVYTRKEALGVCAGIGAWNYPIQIALWKSAPCLAAGNTMVYKPSECTPLHAQLLAEVYLEAGVPPGGFNVVYGEGSVGAYLTAHPGIAKVSFTGQVATGKKVAASAGAGMKSAVMELGGKSPLIILPGADLDQAVDGAMMANFFSTGQVCTNGTRVFVPRDMVAAFEQRLLEKMPNIRVGDPMHETTNFGPLSSESHYRKVIQYIQHGIEVDGATLLYGGLGKPEVASRFSQGYWVRPTVFTNCTDEMKIVQDEIFGPVLSILTYATVDEAIARANDTPLGLAAGVFTKDVGLAHKTIARLHAGITWINTWGESPAEMSVGGWKQSGLGVENGRQGLEAWTRTKSILVDMSDTVPSVFTPL
ncbi:MAG: hypothetical protein M1838_004394 [Thelocarpon superellum]|nr:MAG: hypothetical protein M1838_004394 [Thelocarpon superellum]